MKYEEPISPNIRRARKVYLSKPPLTDSEMKQRQQTTDKWIREGYAHLCEQQKRLPLMLAVTLAKNHALIRRDNKRAAEVAMGRHKGGFSKD